MTFQIITLGCKVNTYESEIMGELLVEAGFSNQETNADITIINTCSVTNMADHKSQKLVRKVKRENPNTILVVAGCSSENKSSVYQAMDIDILIGNKDKSKIVTLIETFMETKERFEKFYHTRNLPFEDMTVNQFQTHTRAFLKIQDGCNNFCSYCIIPYVRGSIRSKNFEVALREAETLVNNGHYELVLTGIHTGSYFDSGHDLTDLIHEMNKINDLKRIRISSIEITELNDKFLKELAVNDKICNHFHVPLQSGSDFILKKMNRKYDLNYFAEKLKQIRKIRPGISITTDVIVGHPYETEDLFFETLATCERFKFSKIHCFPYSVREGTLASKMPEQVEEQLKKSRNRSLVEKSMELENDYAKQFLNMVLTVLVEEKKDGYWIGHTSNYLKVYVEDECLPNTFIDVRLQSLYGDGLIGEKVYQEIV